MDNDSLYVAHPAYGLTPFPYAVSISSTRYCTGLRPAQPFQKNNSNSNGINSSITKIYDENRPSQD